ncbi:hypothetical protein EG329_009020 [Mollisiaceae sp. DMI_Dod_QoI]|nr:hypothetical protein EG329_009020 [Helotiales sp. DMI_Dod_QoI]
MAPDRHLPEESNPLMTKEINVPPYETLVARRRLGQTDLAVKAGQVGTTNSTKAKNLGTFDYAHLRAPLPKGVTSGIFKPTPASYFLMRRSHDGYISATGMFKATFPSAQASEEEVERKYIKSLDTTSPDEIAGNVWIPPQHALQLAEEYQILPWIKALLDNTPIEINPTKDSTPKTISPPPKFLMPQESLTAPTPTRGRPRRSASPSKIASPRKVTGTRSRKAKSESVKSESVEPVSVKTASKNLQESLKAAMTESEASVTEVKDVEEPVVRVNVDTEVEVKGDVETTHTHVEVEMPAGSPELPLPEDTAAMIEKAKEMVEAAVKSQNSDVVSAPKKLKRKAEDIEEEKEEGAAEPVPAKKAKTTATTELRKERIKTRALLGISATLAIGAAVQYAFNIL